MAFCIQKFSAWFCLIFSTENESFKRDFEPFCHLPIDIKLFDYITSSLEMTYDKEFTSALEKTFDFEKYCCFKDYMEVIISKCLEFSTPPSHLRFLMMCTFIYSIISDRTTHKKKCFVFAKMVSQCLIEVYNRHYKDLFENKEDIKSFKNLYKRIEPIFLKRNPINRCRELEPLNQQDIVDLMRNLNYRRKIRRLNFCVRKILISSVCAAFPKDSSMDAEESTSASEYELRMKEESSINESESEVESWKEETDTNESESDEGSQIEDSNINESESDETSSKEESSINESKSDETFSKEESIEKECESGETSSNEDSSISESESNETFSNESSMNESTESLRADKADPNRVCEYCNMKCFEFVYAFLAKEFMKNESDL